jgi:hypothetical protein
MSISVAVISGFAAFMMVAGESSPQPQRCEPPVVSSATTVEAIQSWFQQRGRTVVTFAGYSGAGYEDTKGMLARAGAVLDSLDPRKTIINIGATIDGIGAVYQLAKEKGFETAGIVSSQARESKATLAPCAGTVFFVEDASWGGMIAGTKTLSPTSTAIVRVSDRIVAIGGGDIARDEFVAAKDLGKKTEFVPADMNHAIAIARASRNRQPPPADFRGALGAAMAGTGGR